MAAMTPLAWIAVASWISWLLVTVAGGGSPEVFFGMLGPFVAAAVSWIAYERTHRSAPERLTNLMIAAVALKMLVFGAYVVVLIRVVGFRPVPFVVSFAGYFIALHAMEALFLQRLLRDDLRSPPS